MMKILFNVINEIKYQFYSKILIVITAFITLIMVFNIYSNMNNMKNSYAQYQRSKDFYIQSGQDVKAALSSEAKVKETENPNGTTVVQVDNVLKYDYDNVSRMISVNNPKYLIWQILEFSTFLIFPFIFGIYGVLIANYDLKFKTIKVKAVREEWYKVTLAKILSMILGILITLIISYSICIFAGSLMYKNAIKDIPISEFNMTIFSNPKNIFSAATLSGFLALLFALIGFTLTTIFKSSVIPIIIIVVYNMFIPSLGKYDLKNIISVIGHKYYSFQGTFKLLKPIEVSIGVSVFYIIFITFGFVAASLILAKKQSKFI